MSMQPPVFLRFFLTLLGVAVSIDLRAAALPLFWEREAGLAADSWRGYYEALGLKDPANRFGLHGPEQWLKLGQQLAAREDVNNPWHALLVGLVLLNGYPDRTEATRAQAEGYFARAASLSAAHPGYCVVLISEFHRFGEPQAEEMVLRNLERLFLASGAQSAPLVSQQLIWYAVEAKKAGNREQALRYLAWASAFERHPVWPLLYSAAFAMPHIDQVIAALKELYSLIKEAWPVQLLILRWLEQWTANIVCIFAGAIIVVLGVKYLPRALHCHTHRFPAAIAPALRHGLAAIMYASLVFFGFLPFLWLTAIMTGRYFCKRERIIVGICCGLLTLAPLHSRVHDILTQPSRPDNSLFWFWKTLNEGYYAELDAVVQMRARAHSGDYLSLLANAVSALKRGDTKRADEAIRAAEALHPNDPVVLLTAANVCRFRNDLARADAYFKKCIASFPELEASYFNPTLTYFDERRFVEGIDLIKSASKINPRIVSTFTRKNDDYFGGAWPPLRQFLQPDYRSDYFLGKILYKNSGSWQTADQLWGMAFLGIPLLPSLGISIVLFAILIIIMTKGTAAGHPQRNDFLCRLCAVPMCRLCKRGDICLGCYGRTIDIGDPAIAESIRQTIAARRQRLKEILPRIVDCIFPGVGSLMLNNAFDGRALLYTIVSSGLFATYGLFLQVRFALPVGATATLALPLSAVLLCYYTIFVGRNLMQIARILRTMRR